MNKRAVFAKRKEDRTETFGKNGNPKYVLLGEFWVAEDFNRGTKSLREGAFDAYDTVMFRMDYDDRIDRWCLIQYNGKWYQIQSFNEDYQSNKIQITAIELANQQVNIVDPPTPTYKDIEIWGNSECTVRPSGNPLYVYAQFNSEIRADLDISNGDYKFSVTLSRTVRSVIFAEEWMSNEYNAGQTIPAGRIIQLTSNERTPSQLTKTNFSFEIV